MEEVVQDLKCDFKIINFGLLWFFVSENNGKELFFPKSGRKRKGNFGLFSTCLIFFAFEKIEYH